MEAQIVRIQAMQDAVNALSIYESHMFARSVSAAGHDHAIEELRASMHDLVVGGETLSVEWDAVLLSLHDKLFTGEISTSQVWEICKRVMEQVRRSLVVTRRRLQHLGLLEPTYPEAQHMPEL